MRFATLIAATLPVLAWASPVPEVDAELELQKRCLDHAPDRFKGIHRNLTVVLENVGYINSTLNKIPAGNDTAAYNGTSAFELYEFGAVITKALNATVYAANNSRTNTEKQSHHVYHFLDTKLYPATSSLLDNFITHYINVDKTGIAGIVTSVLETQRDLTAQLGPALIAISNGTSVADSKALSAEFVAAFDKTIDYYQNPPSSTSDSG